jgi:hypothetical protein
MTAAAPTIIVLPIPVTMPSAGSSFPRVTEHRPARHGKTPPGWPLTQPIPRPDQSAVRDLVERGRRALAEERERRAWQELAE